MVVVAVILSFLSRIGAITTEDITSESEKLMELFSEITDFTGVNTKKV